MPRYRNTYMRQETERRYRRDHGLPRARRVVVPGVTENRLVIMGMGLCCCDRGAGRSCNTVRRPHQQTNQSMVFRRAVVER